MPPCSQPVRLFRLWQLLLLAHMLAALAAWWVLPGGFPFAHPRFWANQSLPLLLAGVFGVGFWAATVRRESLLEIWIPLPAAFWLALVASVRWNFPHVGRRWWLIAAGTAILLVLTWHTLRDRRIRWLGTIVLAGSLAVCGAWLPWSQRCDPPSTRPWRTELPDKPASLRWAPAEWIADAANESDVESGSLALVSADYGAELLVVRCGALELTIEPLLRFNRRSPDRGWAPGTRDSMALVHRHFARMVTPHPAQQIATYGGAEPAQCSIYRRGGGLQLDAYVSVPEEVNSHLNSYCAVVIQGHEQLTLAFSPAPDYQAEPVPFGSRHPLRFAYLDPQGRFQLVEASRGEKGPFHALAAGPLGRTDALDVTLYESGAPIARLSFLDWAAQCSTELSPTAGWGVPQNEVGFYRVGAHPGSAVVLMLALARTSVGRGFDSVGHAPGVYRNRLRIEDLSSR